MLEYVLLAFLAVVLYRAVKTYYKVQELKLRLARMEESLAGSA